MPRATPVEFKMYFKVDFDMVIRGHYVHKSVWTSVVDEMLQCGQDTRTEAKGHEENVISFYIPPGPKGTKQPNSKKTLACHVPIELSRILNNFLRANTENNLFVSHCQKKERNRTSCTGKILGCYHGIAHRRGVRERANQQSFEV